MHDVAVFTKLNNACHSFSRDEYCSATIIKHIVSLTSWNVVKHQSYTGSKVTVRLLYMHACSKIPWLFQYTVLKCIIYTCSFLHGDFDFNWCHIYQNNPIERENPLPKFLPLLCYCVAFIVVSLATLSEVRMLLRDRFSNNY
jgi:hypothetical protein